MFRTNPDGRYCARVIQFIFKQNYKTTLEINRILQFLMIISNQVRFFFKFTIHCLHCLQNLEIAYPKTLRIFYLAHQSVVSTIP